MPGPCPGRGAKTDDPLRERQKGILERVRAKDPVSAAASAAGRPGLFLVFSFWGRTLRPRPARSDGSGQRLQCRRPSSGKWAASGSGWRQTGCRPAPALHCVPDAESIHAAACSLQTARLKAAPGSGGGVGLVRLQLEIGVSLFCLGRLDPLQCGWQQCKLRELLHFHLCNGHAQQRGQLRLRNIVA